MFDEQVAEKMLLNGWSTRLNPDHLQRIADALLREKMTNRPITASALLLREKRITRR